MRERGRLCAAGLLVAAAAACGSESGGVPTIALYNAPQENLGAIVQRCNGLANGKYKISLNTLPRDAASQREQIVRRLAAGDHGLDVIGMDVTWTPELAEAGWIRSWPENYAARVREGTLEKPLQTATWNGRLYAAPYNTNVQLLWYRSDLIPNPPDTWSGLMAASARLKAEGKAHYGEIPAAQGEQIVVWFNSLVVTGGGAIIKNNEVSMGDPALKALTLMREYARSAAADPSLPNTLEDTARLAMESGSAAFQLNWPFVYASMAANKPAMLPNFKWAAYPGYTAAGTAPLGGANFGVSTYSSHPTQAYEAALCLRDAQSQKTAAVKDGLPPTLQALYDDPDLAKTYPMRQAILDALKTAAVRPQTPTYQNVSTVIAATVSPPRDIDPPSTLKTLDSQISDALQSKGVLP